MRGQWCAVLAVCRSPGRSCQSVVCRFCACWVALLGPHHAPCTQAVVVCLWGMLGERAGQVQSGTHPVYGVNNL